MAAMRDLAEEHMRLAYAIARRRREYLDGVMDAEDRRSAAFVGLVQAAATYDETRGVAFSTYAGLRISGAIVDEARRLGWRSRRSKVVVQPPRSLDEYEEAHGHPLDLPDREDIPEVTFVRRDELRSLVARADLSPRERYVLWRRYWCGVSASEAGRELGMTARGGQDAHARALRKLREMAVS